MPEPNRAERVRARVRSVFAGATGGSRLARAASWNVVGGAAARVLALAGSFLVARTLGKVGFGQLGIVLNTFTMLGVFASFGLGMTATRFISMLRTVAPQRAGRIAILAPTAAGVLALGGVVCVLIMAPWLARTALNAPELTPLLRLAAPLLLVGALQDAGQGVLAGLESFRALARVSTVAGSASAAGMVAGARLFGLQGCVLGMMLGTSLGCALTFFAVHAEVRRAGLVAGFAGWRVEISPLWEFALPAVLAGSVVVPVNWAATALLVHQPHGYEQMGVFNAANQWRTVILYVPSLVAIAGLPVLANLRQSSSDGEYLGLLRLKILVGLVASSLVAVPVMLAAPLIMKGYGRGFAEGAEVVVVLAGAAIIAATLTMIGQAIVSEGRMWTGLLLNLIWAVVLLGLSLHWIPNHGALGLAWANLAAFGVYLVIMALYFAQLQRRHGPGASAQTTVFNPSEP